MNKSLINYIFKKLYTKSQIKIFYRLDLLLKNIFSHQKVTNATTLNINHIKESV
jgi:hypothetical protein